jgi:hypothetical protein
MIEELYKSGNVALVILAIMAIEALYFSRYYKKLPAILLGLCAGACMILALRAALLQQNWTVIASFLVVGAIIHLIEIWQWLKIANKI